MCDCNNFHYFSYLYVFIVFESSVCVCVIRRCVSSAQKAWLNETDTREKKKCLCISDWNWINKSNDAVYATFTNAKLSVSLSLYVSDFHANAFRLVLYSHMVGIACSSTWLRLYVLSLSQQRRKRSISSDIFPPFRFVRLLRIGIQFSHFPSSLTQKYIQKFRMFL